VSRVAREVRHRGQQLGGQAVGLGVRLTLEDPPTTQLDGVQPDHRCATSQRSRLPSRAATCPRKITSTSRRDPQLKNTNQHDGRSAEAASRRGVARRRRVGTSGNLATRRRAGRPRYVDGTSRITSTRWLRLTGSGAHIADDPRRESHSASIAKESPATVQSDPRAENTINRWSITERFASWVTRLAERGRYRGAARRPGRSRRRRRVGAGLTRTSTRWRRTSPTSAATSPTRATAVAHGDLSRKITVAVKGEICR